MSMFELRIRLPSSACFNQRKGLELGEGREGGRGGGKLVDVVDEGIHQKVIS